MRLVEMGSPARPGSQAAAGRGLRLQRAARRWGPAVRRSLSHFGRTRWPRTGLSRWLPVRPFRLREALQDERYVWWIEQDLLPPDLFRCAAYQVALTVDPTGAPQLAVRTGAAEYPLPQPAIAALDEALARAGRDPALVIPREMGPAFD